MQQELAKTEKTMEKKKRGPKGKYSAKGLEEAVDAYFRRISKLVQVTLPDGSLATNADGECVWRLVYFVPPSITALCLELEIDDMDFDSALLAVQHLKPVGAILFLHLAPVHHI